MPLANQGKGWVDDKGITQVNEEYQNPFVDMFQAETVVAPSEGQWGQGGTAAANYNAQQTQAGQNARGQYNTQGGDAQAQARYQQGQARSQAFGQSWDANERADGAQGRAAPTTNWQQTNDAAAGTQRSLDALNKFAGQQQGGPSAAQAQLQSATNQGLGTQLAMARSGRGLGGSAAAMGQAQSNMAGISANAGNESARIRAQEDAANRDRTLAALNSSLGGNLGFQGQRGTQAQFDTQTALSQRGMNDAYSNVQNQLALGYYGAGNDASLGYMNAGNNAQLGFNQLGEQTNLSHLGLGQHALDQQSQYELEQQQMDLQAQLANQAADTERDSANAGMASSFLSMVGFSDIRAKTDIEKLDGVNAALSRSLGKDSLSTVKDAPGYSYRYKDPGQPGARPGRMVGPMAQDLERGPLGDTVVADTSQGKMIDTGRLTLVNTSALAEQQRQIDALERALGKRAA